MSLSTAEPVPTPRSQFTPVPVLLAESLVILALSQPSFRFRNALFIPVAALYLHAILGTTTGNASGDLGVGSMLAVRLVFALDYLVLTDVWRELWRLEEGPGVKGVEGKNTLGRVMWAIELWNNLRGVGWNFGLGIKSSSPQAEFTSRGRYVLHQLFRITYLYLLHDTCCFIMSHFPALRQGGDIYDLPVLPTRAVLLGVWACTGGSALSMQQAFVGVLAVGVCGGRVEMWPVGMYGRWSEGWSLRQFWGWVFAPSLPWSSSAGSDAF